MVLQRFGSGRLKFDSVWLCFWFSLPQVGSALLRRVPSMIELDPAWFRFLRAQSSLVQVSHGLLEVARVWAPLDSNVVQISSGLVQLGSGIGMLSLASFKLVPSWFRFDQVFVRA